MLDLQTICEDPERVREAMRHKGFSDTSSVDRIIELDRERRQVLTALQAAQTRANTLSKEVGDLMRQGRRTDAEPLKAETSRLKETIKEQDEAARQVQSEQEKLLLEIPNLPHPSVPVGRSSDDNEVVHEWGEKPAFDFSALPHWELAARHRLIDFERGAKVTGAGFPFYIGKGARLQRALINFFLDLAVEEGWYTEIEPPIVINPESAVGTGQLPDKEDLMYEVVRDGLYLVPTAEVPLTNYHRNDILNEADLPIRFCAFTPCFRREAGSYGKDVRGLNRLHQFDKVELVQFVRPETSYEALETMREDAERPLHRLNIPYRRLLMCTGDMGFTQSKKYDLEVWSAGQQRWLEVSSISNFEAFQARRAGIRYRAADQKRPVFVHTLNGSGLALPRIVSAVLENNQQADGSIRIPEALTAYTGFDRIG